jgi:hypothetical protein
MYRRSIQTRRTLDISHRVSRASSLSPDYLWILHKTAGIGKTRGFLTLSRWISSFRMRGPFNPQSTVLRFLTSIWLVKQTVFPRCFSVIRFEYLLHSPYGPHQDRPIAKARLTVRKTAGQIPDIRTVWFQKDAGLSPAVELAPHRVLAQRRERYRLLYRPDM